MLLSYESVNENKDFLIVSKLKVISMLPDGLTGKAQGVLLRPTSLLARHIKVPYSSAERGVKVATLRVRSDVTRLSDSSVVVAELLSVQENVTSAGLASTSQTSRAGS